MGQPSSPSRLQPIDATTLRALVAELRHVVVPSRFEKAQQPDGQTLQLALRHLGGVQWLELSWLAEAPRLLAIPPPPRQGEGSTLASQLQHALRGLALVAIHQQGWERVVSFAFAPRPGEPTRRQLVLELMGRHSNLFLLNAEGQVIALARQVRLAQSRWRPIGTGDLYTPPPALRGEVPRSEEPRDRWQRRLQALPQPLAEALMETYQGLSPALVRQLLEAPSPGGEALPPDRPVRELEPAQWEQLWRRWQAWLSAVERERFSLHWDGRGGYRCWAGDSSEAGAVSPPLALHGALAAATRAWLDARHLERRRSALRHRLEGLGERERRQIGEQEALLAAATDSDDLQRRADALLCLLTPTKEQIQEAQTLYKRARKQRRSVAAIQPRLEAQRQRLAWLEEALVYAEQADQADQLAALDDDAARLESRARSVARESTRQRSRGESPAAVPLPLELRSPSGLGLQVGRNHRQNEWISLRQARRGDLWFHAQEVPGSHVVLKASAGAAEEADLRAAADLAAHFSRGRGNARVPVVMVPVEALQRLPGAEAGTVRHRGGQILWGQPERARALLVAS
ncbi:MAG: NFACT RNA binding domain-containing protein [Cyanobacteriota bacterium]|nr:NFACT RNA binding domain-containing protein [Cyanobacteriota bacterium]